MTRPTLQDIYKARALLANYMSPTPLHHYPGLDVLLGSETYVKHENHTRLGAFKIRGALNTMSQLSPEQKERGIVVASSGNFGQGMAYAGLIFGAKAIVVLPENPNPSKVAAIKAFGAEVVLSDTVYDADPAAIRSIVSERGCQYVSDSTDSRFMAGSGTIMLEILDQLPDVDVVILPVGGGGLASGVSVAAKGLKPDVQVIAVCSAQAASPYLSWKQGMLVDAPMTTFAEGIGVKVTDEIPFRIMCDLLDDFVTVTDDEIRQAIALLLEKTHNLAEGAGAAPLAAALKLKGRLQGKKVALIQSGGNASIEELKASLGATQ